MGEERKDRPDAADALALASEITKGKEKVWYVRGDTMPWHSTLHDPQRFVTVDTMCNKELKVERATDCPPMNLCEVCEHYEAEMGKGAEAQE
jgi:hypothetical protein